MISEIDAITRRPVGMTNQILYGGWNVLLGETKKRCKTPFHLFIVPDSKEFPDGN
jgi:hypothetical protein